MRLSAALALAAAACSSHQDRTAGLQLLSTGAERAAATPFDWQRPERSVSMGADEVAARLGSFDWSATVAWSVTREPDGQPVRMVEHHRVRQAATGEFEVQSDLDPAGSEGGETGKRIIWAGKMTYARSRYAPFGAWRERPTDRGRDARRFRDESFGVAANLLSLAEPWTLVPAADATALGRPAHRFAFSLGAEVRGHQPARPGGHPGDGGLDEDTRRRFAFLDRREPLGLEGELVADAASGAPLKLRLKAAFRVKGDPSTRTEVELSAQVKALGAAVAAVAPPREVLPDERKTRGVARALEAAGLRKRGQATEEEEGADEGD